MVSEPHERFIEVGTLKSNFITDGIIESNYAPCTTDVSQDDPIPFIGNIS